MSTWMSRAMYTKNMSGDMLRKYIHFSTHSDGIYTINLPAIQIYHLVKALDMALRHNLSVKEKEWRGEYNSETPLGEMCEAAVDGFISKMANSGYLDDFMRFYNEQAGEEA